MEVYGERETDPNINWYMGLAYAGLGREQDAVRHADRAVELLAASGNALRTGYIQPNVIWIYTMVGDYESAIGQVEYLLSVPSSVSARFLEAQPLLAPLRSDSRFLALLDP
jgi:hypothetical protein